MRRLDDLGRIQLPRQLRSELGIEAGDCFTIGLDEDKNIVLRKIQIVDGEMTTEVEE